MKEIIIDDLNEQSPYESHYKRKANYYETDQMGIVHHSNYIRWFEEARMNFMEEIGFPYAKVEEMGIIVPVLGVNAQYRTMVKYGETVDIYTKITKFTGLKMNIELLQVEKFDKCNNIWDMKKQKALAEKFRNELLSGNRITYVCFLCLSFMLPFYHKPLSFAIAKTTR